MVCHGRGGWTDRLFEHNLLSKNFKLLLRITNAWFRHSGQLLHHNHTNNKTATTTNHNHNHSHNLNHNHSIFHLWFRLCLFHLLLFRKYCTVVFYSIRFRFGLASFVTRSWCFWYRVCGSASLFCRKYYCCFECFPLPFVCWFTSFNTYTCSSLCYLFRVCGFAHCKASSFCTLFAVPRACVWICALVSFPLLFDHILWLILALGCLLHSVSEVRSFLHSLLFHNISIKLLTWCCICLVDVC